MNTDVLKGKWLEAKGEILNKWGKLTDNELNETKGNIAAIAGIIQQRYGEKKEEITEKLSAIFERGKEVVADKSDKMKQSLNEEKQRRDSEFQPSSNPRNIDEIPTPPSSMPEQPMNDPLVDDDKGGYRV